MRAAILSVGVFALAVSAHEYPNCEHDNCYRAMIGEQGGPVAETFCPAFLAATTTEAAAIPTALANCGGDITRVSSACSCITYSLTHTSSEVPPTSTPETTTTPTSEASSDIPETTAPPTTSWTTSTITTTKTYTITSCPPAVPDCPVGSVTSEVIITTTVCPATETPAPPPHSTLETHPAPPPPAHGTGAPAPPSTTRPGTGPTAAAGRVVAGVGAAAAGLLAALL